MKTVAVAGVGAIGAAVCRALIDGIDGFKLVAASDLDQQKSLSLINRPDFDLPFVPLSDITAQADWIVEALPAALVPELIKQDAAAGKTFALISSAALLLYPEMRKEAAAKGAEFLIPAGALAGMDGINALAEQKINSAKLTTSKPPMAFSGAPYIVKEEIDLAAVKEPTVIFKGHALDAAAAFPANVNVAATLTMASRLAPQDVEVEIRAVPGLVANCHEVVVTSDYSTLSYKMENLPDPANPKSSTLAALSMIAALRREYAPFWVG